MSDSLRLERQQKRKRIPFSDSSLALIESLVFTVVLSTPGKNIEKMTFLAALSSATCTDPIAQNLLKMKALRPAHAKRISRRSLGVWGYVPFICLATFKLNHINELLLKCVCKGQVISFQNKLYSNSSCIWGWIID